MPQPETKIPLLEEHLKIDKHSVVDGYVHVMTDTDLVEAVVDIQLARQKVDVSRVALDVEIQTPPAIRTEGDVTIVPIVEERMVKRLFLIEEIHIRRDVTTETETHATVLRRQTATVVRTNDEKETDMTIENASNAYSAASGTSNTLTAFFDSRSDAENAVKRLEEAGIPHDSIRFVPGYEADGDRAIAGSDDRKGFWAALEDFFFPNDDRLVYSEGLRRGGFLVSVSRISDDLYKTAHAILDDEGSIDIDERADQWRSEGWDTSAANASAAASEHDRNLSALGTSREDAFDAPSDDGTIKVVEENLRVGKRDVNSGSVKVRAYTIETPVSENVSLRDEEVTITRRPVDRPVDNGDAVFQDRTISAEEHHEEAVVSKDARVVEEIGIRKSATERTETINESVRKTEVEIDDQRNQTQSQGAMTQRQGFNRD